jgi:hypothetical protein
VFQFIVIAERHRKELDELGLGRGAGWRDVERRAHVAQDPHRLDRIRNAVGPCGHIRDIDGRRCCVLDLKLGLEWCELCLFDIGLDNAVQTHFLLPPRRRGVEAQTGAAGALGGTSM